MAVAGASFVLSAGCAVTAPPPHRITADFENSAGLFVGNSVTVLGLDVGEVEKIIPRPGYVEVHLSVDPAIDLPDTVIAALISPSIVTDRHIELTPPYTGGPILADDAHLPLTRTRTPVEMDTVIATIDQFARSLAPVPGTGSGPLSGNVTFAVLDGRGQRIRETLDALSAALEVGVHDKDAIANIIIRLQELTAILAENEQSTREFSASMTRMSELLAEQALGLQATLHQLNSVVGGTATVVAQRERELGDALTGLTAVTDQLRANSSALIELVDLTPLLMQNIDGAIDRDDRFFRGHLLVATAASGEVISVFCERVQLKSDGCRTGRVEDMGPDLGFTAALLGLTG
ncbi:MCE family protein [Nocardia sp. NPDC055053]